MIRGEIRNQEFAKQLRIFSGLQWGSITPTDIDAFIEIHDETFIFIETKYQGKPLYRGQELAYERLINNLLKQGKQAIAIIAKHEIKIPDNIMVSDCEVSRYFYKNPKSDPINPSGIWRIVQKKVTVKDFCDSFIAAGRDLRIMFFIP